MAIRELESRVDVQVSFFMKPLRSLVIAAMAVFLLSSFRACGAFLSEPRRSGFCAFDGRTESNEPAGAGGPVFQSPGNLEAYLFPVLITVPTTELGPVMVLTGLPPTG